MSSSDLDKLGTKSHEIAVRFSIRSLQLFSDGLYSSPHKAIEELVSNSYDAGAKHVNVVLRDETSKHGEIIVIDDGVGMDAEAIARHWLIGESNKRSPDYKSPLGREPIGKFGIGKLATYVLANKFHLISKSRGKYWIATMDYADMIPQNNSISATKEREYNFWVRTLTESQARKALDHLTSGDGAGYDSIHLFGSRAAKSWTVAELTDLRPLAEKLRPGTTRWVLSTALPLQSDFHIYLDGTEIRSSKSDRAIVQDWVIGKDFTPEIDEIVTYSSPKTSNPANVGLIHPALDRVWGHFTLYEDIIADSKADRFGRSHGFFVYVRGRLLNEDDPYFGIPENTLRHGTFSRFRLDIHIDSLDFELRSSRETYLETSNVAATRDILKSCFAEARIRQRGDEEQLNVEGRVVDRLTKSPYSVTRLPMLTLAERATSGNASPRLTNIVSSMHDGEPNIDSLKDRARENKLFTEVVLVTDLTAEDGMCVFDAHSGILKVNLLHPFVAHFSDSFDSKRAKMALELLATSEVLLEASLYENIRDEKIVVDLMEQRDVLLRSLARSAANRSPNAVATRLRDTATNWKQFELALVDAFQAMGFYAQHVGGSKKPDGIADAKLTPVQDGIRRAYRVSLEAKKHQRNLSKDEAKAGTVAIHRDRSSAQHAIIVAENFTNDEATLVEEVRRHNESDKMRFDQMNFDDQRAQGGRPKTITLARVDEIASLVRLVAYKRINLERLRDLFACETPDEVKAYVTSIRSSTPNRKHFREILAVISTLQETNDASVAQYGTIEYVLNRDYNLKLEKEEIREACHAMELMSNGLIYASDYHVELNSHPELIVQAITDEVNEFPERERSDVRETLALNEKSIDPKATSVARLTRKPGSRPSVKKGQRRKSKPTKL